MEETNTHWRKFDFRKTCLEFIIDGISESLRLLKQRIQNDPNYDGLFYFEDAEQVLGLAFIAFQSYINGSIYDLYNDLSNKEIFYKIVPKMEKSNRTKIELVISVANYFKHKDDSRLHSATEKTLRDFNLIDDSNPIKSPVIDALDILTLNYEIKEISEIVFDWRETLFNQFENSINGN
jgi:hypothetical protein